MKIDGNLIALYVLSKKPVIRYSAVLVILTIICIAWFQLLFVPLSISTNTQKNIFNQLQARLNSIQTETALLASLSKEVISLQTDISKLSKDSDSSYLQDRLFALISTIKNQQLTLITWQPEPVLTKTWYVKQRIACTLQGRFEQFMSFFATVAKQNLLLQFTQLTFEKQDSLLRAHCLFDFIFKQGDLT